MLSSHLFLCPPCPKDYISAENKLQSLSGSRSRSCSHITSRYGSWSSHVWPFSFFLVCFMPTFAQRFPSLTRAYFRARVRVRVRVMPRHHLPGRVGGSSPEGAHRRHAGPCPVRLHPPRSERRLPWQGQLYQRNQELPGLPHGRSRWVEFPVENRTAVVYWCLQSNKRPKQNKTTTTTTKNNHNKTNQPNKQPIMKMFALLWNIHHWA